MKKDMKVIAQKQQSKLAAAARLLQASLDKLPEFDPSRTSTPDELEPYDALCDRFVRAVEVTLKFFRAYERYMYGEESETVRDTLNRIIKLDLISEVELWMEMRTIRNRIVHYYLPDKLKELYDLIMFEYGREVLRTAEEARKIDFN